VTTIQVLAEMTAMVSEARVMNGSSVESGDVLFVLESMKMEIPIEAQQNGVAARVRVAVGDVVNEGSVLLEYEPK
jgi:acetyl-CoA carboxylase biotin carboxyl carrier protein